MFDIGWSELLLIGVIAILVVGPKDLPRMLRTTGRMMGQVRRTANDFRRQFDDALREAEREADLGETRDALNSIGKINPVADIRKELNSAVADIEKPVKSGTGDAAAKGAAAAAGAAATADVPSFEPAEDDPVREPTPKADAEQEPAKPAVRTVSGAASGSDAA